MVASARRRKNAGFPLDRSQSLSVSKLYLLIVRSTFWNPADMNEQERLNILQIAQRICRKYGCEILHIDFENYEVQIEGPEDQPEVRAACVKELGDALDLFEQGF